MSEPRFELTVISEDCEAVRLSIPAEEAYGLLRSLEQAIAEFESDESRRCQEQAAMQRGDTDDG